MQSIENKFNQIIESYINGNISWVKAEVKKLSVKNRKLLYRYAEQFNSEVQNFFFTLI